RALWVGLKGVEMRPHFAGYCAFGVALMLGLQALVSIGVNLGLLATKGLTLPLGSAGASSVLMSCVAVGRLLRVSSERGRAERQVARLRGEAAHATAPDADADVNEAPVAPAPARAATASARIAGRLRRRVEPTLGSAG